MLGSRLVCRWFSPVRRDLVVRRSCMCLVWWAWSWALERVFGSDPWLRSFSGWGSLVPVDGRGLGVWPLVGWVWSCLVAVRGVEVGVAAGVCMRFITFAIT